MFFTAVCHCVACQKSTGTSFSVVVGVRRDDLKVTEGSPTVYQDTGDSGETTNRYFCSRCGSTIFAEMESKPGLACIKAGTLDSSIDLRPQMHVYWRDHHEWLSTLDHLPAHETIFQK